MEISTILSRNLDSYGRIDIGRQLVTLLGSPNFFLFFDFGLKDHTAKYKSCHLFLSSATSLHLIFSFIVLMSFFTQSFHLNLGFPKGFFPMRFSSITYGRPQSSGQKRMFFMVSMHKARVRFLRVASEILFWWCLVADANQP